MPRLKEHPQMVYRGQRVEWPPLSGWVTEGGEKADPKEIPSAHLMHWVYRAPDPGSDEPYLQLHITTLRHRKYRRTLHLDSNAFLLLLTKEFERVHGTVSLEDIGNMQIAEVVDGVDG